MSQQWSVAGSSLLVSAIVVVVLLAAVLLSALVVSRRARRDAALERARHERDLDALRAQVERIEQSLTRRAGEPATAPLLITTAGDETHDPGRADADAGSDAGSDERSVVAARVVPAPLFADLVLRESVVQAASWTAGVRRALSPEHRQRVRLAMRREVKLARKQRRAELRAARREWQSRQRSAQPATQPASQRASQTGARTGEGSAA